MAREPTRPVDIPPALRTDVNSAMALITQRGVDSLTTQEVKDDLHIWKIHIYRESESVTIIRLVDKGLA